MVTCSIMTTKEQAVTKDYESFDSLAYINRKYSTMNELVAVPLREMHHAWDSIIKNGGRDLKVLDYGCGPTPVYLCSAPRAAAEVVFADYGKVNRDVLETWLGNRPGSPDFTPFFRFVVQELEGQEGEGPVLQRQEELRKLVRAIVPCDATKDPPIAPGYQGPYDLINCSLCLAVAALSIEEYSNYLGRLTKMLKPGGKLFLNSIDARDGATHFDYPTGEDNSQYFRSLSMNESNLSFVLTQSGCSVDSMRRTDIDKTPGAYKHVSPEAAAMIFVSATRQ